MLVHLRITELLVHGWDLAHATGQPPGLPGDLAQTELELSRAQLGHAPPDTMPIAGRGGMHLTGVSQAGSPPMAGRGGGRSRLGGCPRAPGGVGGVALDCGLATRSEERRVGKECRSRWWLIH